MGKRKVRQFAIPVVFAEYDVRITPKHPKVDGREVLGYCEYEPRQIRVYCCPTNTELFRATLWHEWFHAAFRELGRAELTYDEALVDGLANALMRVRLEHPDL